MARDFPLVPVRRADAGPSQRGHRIVCSVCRATDEVINSGPHKVVPGPLVTKRFAQAGWVVGAREGRDLCPACAAKSPKKETLPMVKATAPVTPSVVAPPMMRSEEARMARLIVDQLLVDHFDPASGKYHEGWSDDRVAKEATMSLDFVQKRRDAEHGALKHDVEPERLTALLAEFRAKEVTLGARLMAAQADVRAAYGKLEDVLKDMSIATAGHEAALRRITDGK